MEDIDKAARAQEWLMKHYHQWIPLDACLALIRHVGADDQEAEEPPADQAAEEAESRPWRPKWPI